MKYVVDLLNNSFVSTGTLGQPKIWDITNPVSYQHPMAPYDVLVDPHTLPDLPKIDTDVATTPVDTKDADEVSDSKNE